MLSKSKLIALRIVGGGSTNFSDSFARADGDLGNGWDYSAGVWNIASGSLSSNPSTTGSNLVPNGDFETGDPPTGWTALNSATLSSAADPRDGSAGTKSINALIAAAQTQGGLTRTVSSLSLSKYYKTEFWSKDVTTSGIFFVLFGGSASYATLAQSLTWRKTTLAHRAFATGTAFAFTGQGVAGNQSRVDDLSYFELTKADLFASKNFGYSDFDASLKINVAAGQSVGLCLCMDAANPSNYINFYYFRTLEGTAYILYVDKYVSGVVTDVYRGTFTPNYSANKVLRVKKKGSVLKISYDGVQTISDIKITDASIISNTRHGIFNTSPDNAIDDYSITSLPTLGLLEGDANAIFAAVSEKTLWSTSGSQDWLGRPSLAISGANWVLVYRGATHHTVDTSAQIHIRFSADEGVTWSNEDKTIADVAVTGFPIDDQAAGSAGVGEGNLIACPNGDLLVHTYEWLGKGSYQYRSTDGGATWSNEGRINNDTTLIFAQDFCIVSDVIYCVVLTDADSNGETPWGVSIYKSADNGATWVLQGVVEVAANGGNEAGIALVSGSRMVLLMRGGNPTNTYQYYSDDLGATWTARQDVTSVFGVMQRPRIFKTTSGLIAHGRDYYSAASAYTVVYYSSDGGANWIRKFYPTVTKYVDCGYTAILKRADGKFYMTSYAGASTTVAALKEYIFNIT